MSEQIRSNVHRCKRLPPGLQRHGNTAVSRVTIRIHELYWHIEIHGHTRFNYRPTKTSNRERLSRDPTKLERGISVAGVRGDLDAIDQAGDVDGVVAVRAGREGITRCRVEVDTELSSPHVNISGVCIDKPLDAVVTDGNCRDVIDLAIAHHERRGRILQDCIAIIVVSCPYLERRCLKG